MATVQSNLIAVVAPLLTVSDDTDRIAVASQALQEILKLHAEGDLYGNGADQLIRRIMKDDPRAADQVANYVAMVIKHNEAPKGVAVGKTGIVGDFDGEDGGVEVPADWVNGNSYDDNKYLSRRDDAGDFLIGASKGRLTRKNITAGAAHPIGGPIFVQRPILPEGDVQSEQGHRVDYVQGLPHPVEREGYILQVASAANNPAVDAGRIANITRRIGQAAAASQAIGVSDRGRDYFGRSVIYHFENATELAHAFDAAVATPKVRVSAYTPTPLGVGNPGWVDVRQRLDGGHVERIYNAPHALSSYVETNATTNADVVRKHAVIGEYKDEGSKAVMSLAPNAEGKVDLQKMMKESSMVAEHLGKTVRVDV